MRYSHFAAAALFLLIAALQFNDPDPIYWIAAYVGTAAVAGGLALGRYSRFWTGAVIGLVLAGMLQTFSAVIDYLAAGDYGIIFSDMMTSEYVEPTREFGGLLLAFALLVFYAAAQKR